MHDREIALWNARMRIYFDANVMGKVQFLRIETSLTSFHFVTWFASLVCVLKTFNDYCRKYCLGCRNLQRHSQLPTWWTHIFFFFALSISFLLVPHVLPCSKPTGLVMCLQVCFYYLRLCRLVLKRNKMHDREIALWNARKGINFDANVMESVESVGAGTWLYWTSPWSYLVISALLAVEFRKILA